MEITEYLPVDFRTQMEAETLCGAEEIRLRVGQPLEILYADEKEKEIGLLTEAHMREVLNYLCLLYTSLRILRSRKNNFYQKDD